MARRAPPQTNLPVERGAFVGRERGLQAIARVLGEDSAGAPRVLALTGPAGVGKTRLALRAAARELPRYGQQGGVWLVECLGVDDGRGLIRLIGLMLGLLPDATAGDDVERARVVSVLNDRGACVVVVDGVDAVKDAVAVLRDVAAAARGVRFLVTQRAPVLEQDGVSAFTVGPLSSSKKTRGEESEAAQLFVERLAEVRGTHTRTLSPQDLVSVAHIVKHLEGVPQAIELAAARCRVLTPGELLERLPRNLQALSSTLGQKSALSGVVAWSLDLLQPWERATLAQCVIFHGGFAKDAARAVVDLSEVDGAPDVDAAIDSLVEKALLKVVPSGLQPGPDDEELRYVHPPAVRDLIVAVRPARTRTPLKASTLELLPGAFSGEGPGEPETARIELSTTREALVKRHAQWALKHCGALKEGVDGHGGLVARRRLEREQENLLAVVRRSLSEETATLTSLTQALLALSALEPVMTTRGPHDLFARLLDRALEPAEAAGVSPALVARSLEMRARLRRGRGQLSSSKSDLDQALLLARKAKDRLLEARTLANLGTHALFIGDLKQARVDYDDAIGLMRAERELRLEGRCVGFFGLLEEEGDHLDAAAQHYLNAIEIHVTTGDRRWEAIHQTQLGRVRLAQGNHETAHELLRRSLVLHRELWNRRLEALTLLLLGDLAAVSHNLIDAEGLWNRAAPIVRDIGDPTVQALAHVRLSWIGKKKAVDVTEHDAVVDACLARIDDPQITAAVATFRGAPRGPAARGVQVRAAERVVAV